MGASGHTGAVRVALVQLTSTPDVTANRATVARLLAEAATSGADVVVLPELWPCLGSATAQRAAAEPLDGPLVEWIRAQAVGLGGAWLVAGSVIEALPEGDRVANTALVIDPAGELRATYRKIHLFDCAVPGAELRESDTFVAGGRPLVTDIAGVRCGVAICYDLRFPELFRRLADDGARLVVVPAAFTARTGRDHWELLVRARAIDAQVFVVAVDQCGASTTSQRWHGGSMAVDPWGTVLARAGATEGVTVVDLELGEVDRVRTSLPVLAHRRPDVTGGGTPVGGGPGWTST